MADGEKKVGSVLHELQDVLEKSLSDAGGYGRRPGVAVALGGVLDCLAKVRWMIDDRRGDVVEGLSPEDETLGVLGSGVTPEEANERAEQLCLEPVLKGKEGADIQEGLGRENGEEAQEEDEAVMLETLESRWTRSDGFVAELPEASNDSEEGPARRQKQALRRTRSEARKGQVDTTMGAPDSTRPGGAVAKLPEASDDSEECTARLEKRALRRARSEAEHGRVDTTIGTSDSTRSGGAVAELQVSDHSEAGPARHQKRALRRTRSGARKERLDPSTVESDSTRSGVVAEPPDVLADSEVGPVRHTRGALRQTRSDARKRRIETTIEASESGSPCIDLPSDDNGGKKRRVCDSPEMASACHEMNMPETGISQASFIDDKQVDSDDTPLRHRTRTRPRTRSSARRRETQASAIASNSDSLSLDIESGSSEGPSPHRMRINKSPVSAKQVADAVTTSTPRRKSPRKSTVAKTLAYNSDENRESETSTGMRTQQRQSRRDSLGSRVKASLFPEDKRSASEASSSGDSFLVDSSEEEEEGDEVSVSSPPPARDEAAPAFYKPVSDMSEAMGRYVELLLKGILGVDIDGVLDKQDEDRYYRAGVNKVDDIIETCVRSKVAPGVWGKYGLQQHVRDRKDIQGLLEAHPFIDLSAAEKYHAQCDACQLFLSKSMSVVLAKDIGETAHPKRYWPKRTPSVRVAAFPEDPDSTTRLTLHLGCAKRAKLFHRLIHFRRWVSDIVRQAALDSIALLPPRQKQDASACFNSVNLDLLRNRALKRLNELMDKADTLKSVAAAEAEAPFPGHAVEELETNSIQAAEPQDDGNIFESASDEDS